MARARQDLEKQRLRVEKGELKEAEKIGAAAAKILGRNHGHRYFAWELRQGQFHYFEHPVNFARERACEGKYVIQTEESELTPAEAVAAYKQLNEVERGFAHLKGLLEVRPVIPPERRSGAGACVCGGAGVPAGTCLGKDATCCRKPFVLSRGVASIRNRTLRQRRNRHSYQAVRDTR